MKKTLIQRIEVGSGGAASIEFTSIPQTYTDLYIVYSIRGDRDLPVDWMQFNINSQGYNTNITTRFFSGDGSGVSNGTAANQAGGAITSDGSTANTFSNTDVYIPNYTASTNKSFSINAVSENNGTTAVAFMSATLWSQTAPITSIGVDPLNDSFVEFSSATLYGITAGSDGATTVS